MSRRLVSLFLTTLLVVMLTSVTSEAAAKKQRIIYIPHDNRPISFEQTVNSVKGLNYEILTPPEDLLGNRTYGGDPDGLWRWLFKTTVKSFEDKDNEFEDYIVVSSDALIYGSLVASRKHEFSDDTILRRVDNFKALRKFNPNAKIYVFSSIMRSPKVSNGGVEPNYYEEFGPAIFEITSLRDKAEIDGLNAIDAERLNKLQSEMPNSFINDWLSRRKKNFGVNVKLIEYAKEDIFDYLALGRDDNAVYSQTSKENRELSKLTIDLSADKFRSLAGVDEMGLILLTRAVNNIKNLTPRVYVQYGYGIGGATIPTYSDSEISKSINDHILAAGGKEIYLPNKIDIVLMVNTNEYGITRDASSLMNRVIENKNIVEFVDKTGKFIDEGYNVAIADIAFSNGADNDLMAQLEKRDLLGKLTAYSGWNTADNSAGFVIGQSLLAQNMSKDKIKELLAIRLVDDWGYQANVRQQLLKEVLTPENISYVDLSGKESVLEQNANKRIYKFIGKHLWRFDIKTVKLSFPWKRMFEVKVDLNLNYDNQSLLYKAKGW